MALLSVLRNGQTGIPELWTQVLDAGLWKLDFGLWNLDSGCWTLDPGRWTLHLGRWALGTGHGRWLFQNKIRTQFPILLD